MFIYNNVQVEKRCMTLANIQLNCFLFFFMLLFHISLITLHLVWSPDLPVGPQAEENWSVSLPQTSS